MDEKDRFQDLIEKIDQAQNSTGGPGGPGGSGVAGASTPTGGDLAAGQGILAANTANPGQPEKPLAEKPAQSERTAPTGGDAAGQKTTAPKTGETGGHNEPLPAWLTQKKEKPQTGATAQKAPPAGAKAADNPREKQDAPAATAEKKSEPTPQDKPRQAPPSQKEKQPEVKGPAMAVDLSRYSEAPAPQAETTAPGRKGKKAKEKKQVQKKYRVGRALIMTLVFLGISIYLAFFAIRSFEDLTGVTLFGGSEVEESINIEIPEGASLREICKILKDGGVINEPLTFQLYAWIRDRTDFKPGEYIMTDKMDYNSIIYALRMGTERTDIVEIVFPEGLSVLDMARTLEEKGVCSADGFINAVKNSSFNYAFVDQIPKDALRYYRLEGYLFPNTHQFFIGENPESVINRFLKDFSGRITEEMRVRMNELNMTLDDVLTLASIIQMEASDPTEMKNVSEVYHNRLQNPDVYALLQSDPTIYYVERVIKKTITNTNQAMYDAYNTYVCTGLPVGPICNPGEDAIMAALYPAAHEQTYYFFVTDKAGTYYYAETDEQHEINKAQADKINKQVEAEQQAASSAAPAQ